MNMNLCPCGSPLVRHIEGEREIEECLTCDRPRVVIADYREVEGVDPSEEVEDDDEL
jgi:hypothetical protein